MSFQKYFGFLIILRYKLTDSFFPLKENIRVIPQVSSLPVSRGLQNFPLPPPGTVPPPPGTVPPPPDTPASQAVVQRAAR